MFIENLLPSGGVVFIAHRSQGCIIVLRAPEKR
jgi:hypothetical protein